MCIYEKPAKQLLSTCKLLSWITSHRAGVNGTNAHNVDVTITCAFLGDLHQPLTLTLHQSADAFHCSLGAYNHVVGLSVCSLSFSVHFVVIHMCGDFPNLQCKETYGKIVFLKKIFYDFLTH